ncbi:MAG: thioredoxin-disulfide reductase, partial [Candidatus Hydrogenedentes bacterium]|nr:thioredoxin-disulfide reductase [Candidatus Hydrogenedentota bacterium]
MENVIIIGSGPAGFTAALYTARANLNPLMLEGELSKDILPGGQLMTTTEVENYPGFPEGVSGPALMDLLRKQALHFGTRIESKTVTKVDFSKRPFTLYCGDEALQTKSVIIATGATARYLGLPSEEKYLNRGVSACATCDGALPRFRNKPLIVVGGGDTAMEEANFLSGFASRVHVVHRRDKFRASPIMADRTIANPKITVEWNSVVDEILGEEKAGVTAVRIKNVQTGELKTIECSGYFSAIGHKPNTDLFVGLLDMDETGYLVTKPGTSLTNIEGVFAAGDVQDKI